MGKLLRTLTRKFKVEAVKLVTEQGRSFAEAAASLGDDESLFRKWKKDLDDQGDQAFPAEGNLPALEEELGHLRAGHKRLQMERARDTRFPRRGSATERALPGTVPSGRHQAENEHRDRGG